MDKQNLILTIMHGYDYPFVEPFLTSLKKVNYNGDLVIFVSDSISKTTRKFLKKQGAIIIDYNAKYPFIDEYSSAFKDIDSAITINNYRFILYLHFLTDNGGKYKNVILIDIRDVIFQVDPFKMLPEGKICFFLENCVQTFHHKDNYQWLCDATDIDTANQLIEETVSCAGVTAGSTPLIIDYLNYLKEKLSFRSELKWGLDQGIHNSYIYLIKPAYMLIYGDEEPFVTNLGAYQPYILNKNDEVVNAHGDRYAIVHQYDRFGELLKIYKNRYIGNYLVQKFKRLYFLLMP